MSIKIPCRRIRRLKRRSYQMLKSARKAGQKPQQDPLFQQLGELSHLVSEIESIKKRQGAVLRECLLAGIDGVKNWQSATMPAKYVSSKEMILCWNEHDKKVCAFETKRGHGDYDSASIKALDRRLDTARQCLDKAAEDLSISNAQKDVFVVSFYGKVWNLDHDVYTINNVGNVFDENINFLVSSFMEFHRKLIEDEYCERFPEIQKQGNLDLAGVPNMFLDISEQELRKYRRIKIHKNQYDLEAS